MRTSYALALALASCGRPSTTGTPNEQEPPPPSAPVAVVALHEWGLVDVDLASGTVELSAGPGTPARPVVARKPVLYAHLVDGDTASVDLRVRLPEGAAVLEHWPPADVQGAVIPWRLDVRRGACPAAPSRDLAAACDAPDGYCEIAELPRYVTRDHDCMQVGGQSAALLFYRASIPAGVLPLRIERAPDGAVRVTSARPRPEGPPAVLRISTALSGPWPPGHVVISRAERPAQPGTVEIPVGSVALDPAAERSALARTITTDLGLSADEARVFVEAWGDELFGRASAARETPPPRAQDVLLYWLAPSEVGRLSALEAAEPISVRRAFLVRVDLGGVTTAGPAAR